MLLNTVFKSAIKCLTFLILFSKLRTIGSSLHYQLYSVTTLRGCRLWPFILISSLYSTLFNSPVYLEITLKWFPLVYKFEPAAFNTVPGCFNSGNKVVRIGSVQKVGFPADFFIFSWRWSWCFNVHPVERYKKTTELPTFDSVSLEWTQPKPNTLLREACSYFITK